MYHELYIDIFFLENVMIDSLILLAVRRLIGSGSSFIRVFAGGTAGSFLTCILLALPVPAPIRIICLHLVVNTVMIVSAFSISSVREFFKAVFFLYVVSVFFGGIMEVFRPYMKFIGFFYMTACVSYILFIQLWKILDIIRRKQERLLDVTLYGNRGTQIKAVALWDTGNQLQDFVTGEPVCVISSDLAKSLSSEPEQEKGYHLIPYQCVDGEDMMQVFRIEKMCIHGKKKDGDEEYWIRRPLLGVGKGDLSSGKEFSMILNPDIFL